LQVEHPLQHSKNGENDSHNWNCITNGLVDLAIHEVSQISFSIISGIIVNTLDILHVSDSYKTEDDGVNYTDKINNILPFSAETKSFISLANCYSSHNLKYQHEYLSSDAGGHTKFHKILSISRTKQHTCHWEHKETQE
jgi:hypothetical protein